MRPIVFLTDYGLADEFVGVCHGVMRTIAPDVRIIDLAHAVPRQDVLRGALILGRAARYMPADAVHLAVVDPGVGSARTPVAIETGSGALLVGPDNGLLSVAWGELGGAARAVEISSEAVMLHPVSKTFHGRDVFAPAAAHLAAGLPLEEAGPAMEPSGLRTVALPGPMVAPGQVGARVVAVDQFGNVQLNATATEVKAAGLGGVLQVESQRARMVETFSDVREGDLAAMIDSQGYVALAVNGGSAAEKLGLAPWDTVVLAAL